MALEFLCNKGNHIGFIHLQITYKKVRNLRIGVNKLVGKVLINLLHHTKLAVYIINIIIDAPAFAYAVISS